MSEATRCRSCGLENPPGRDFCERCGEYLAWAPTTMVAAVPESAVQDDEASTSGPEERSGDGARAGDAGAAATAPPRAAGGEPDDDEYEEFTTADRLAAAAPAAPAAGDEETTRIAPVQAGGAPAASQPGAPVTPAPGQPGHPVAPGQAGEPAAPAEPGEGAAPEQPGDPAAAQPGAPAPPGELAEPGDPASPNGVTGKRRGLPTPRIPALRRTASRRAAQTRVAATPPVAQRPPLVPPPPPPAGAAPPPPAPTPEVPAASGDASIVLQPADPVAGLGGVPGVDPGSTIAFRATIRNESQIVDNYDLAVLGLPEGWTIVSPTAAFLVPLGAGRGDSELQLRIDISPPRDYRSTAGIWTFELIALSRTHATVAARAIAQFEVRPFQAWSVEVIPTVNAGRFKARYRAAVRNDGNAEQDLWPIAIEDSGKLRMAFARGRLTLEAGEVGADTLTLKPRLPKPVGRVIEHRVGVDVVAIEPEVEETLSAKQKLAAKAKEKGKDTAKGVKVSAKGIALPRPRIPRPQDLLKKFKPDPNMLSRLRGGPGDANAPLTARQVVFRQKPVIPLWLIALIVLIAVAGVAIYLLLPRKTTVPNLVGVSTSFEAEKRLRANDLVLTQPAEPRVEADAKPGSVIGQSPSPGTKLDKDASVSIVVAVGTKTVAVPHLQGLTRVKADERLRRDGLELGDTQPSDAPDNYVVKSQIPDAELSVAKGTSVRVFLKKPPPTAKQKKVAATKKKAAAKKAAVAKKVAASKITVPKFAGKPLAAYTAALDKLGLKATVTTTIAASAAGTVLSTDPKPGAAAKKGDAVKVRASSGPASLAVQTASRVVVFNTVGAKELFRLPLGATEPSYFPDGSQVVYRSGSKIQLAGAGKGAKPSTLYSGPDDLRRPTVAPDNETIAVIRVEEGDGDLCFGRNVPDIFQLCLPDDGWDLDGRISWRRDGKAVLVGGHRQSDPAVFGVRVYRTSVAFATDPLLWKGTTASAATTGKGVLSATFSPDGKRIAAISNADSDGFEVALTDGDDLSFEQAKSTGTAGCDVVWRSDGKELAAVQEDAGCTQTLGKVVSFAASAPTKTSPVAAKGRNPAYRPTG